VHDHIWRHRGRGPQDSCPPCRTRRHHGSPTLTHELLARAPGLYLLRFYPPCDARGCYADKRLKPELQCSPAGVYLLRFYPPCHARRRHGDEVPPLRDAARDTRAKYDRALVEAGVTTKGITPHLIAATIRPIIPTTSPKNRLRRWGVRERYWFPQFPV